MNNSSDSTALSYWACLVNEYYYDLGLLAPAIIIIFLLSFMDRRVNLKLELLHGRPGVPIVVDFLGKGRKRFAIAMAYGATASSCFEMFYENVFNENVTGVSHYIPKSPYAKAFKPVIYTLLYGICNYPYFACLQAKHKVVGCTIGFMYALIRCIADLTLYLGCTGRGDFANRLKHKRRSHWLYVDMFINLPSVICTILLCASYAVFLYKYLKQKYSTHTLIQATIQSEPVAENIHKIHVRLLLQNRLHRLSVTTEEEPWHMKLIRRIYESRPDFKFSTQFLSAVFVSFIFVYQLTLLLVLKIDLWKQLVYFKDLRITLILDYAIAALLLGSVVVVIQLILFVQNHRSDVLRIYRTGKGILPDEYVNPKTLVTKCLRFCGYQIGITAVGQLVISLAIFFLLLPILICKYTDMLYGRDYLLQQLKEIFLWILPLFLAPLLIWLSMVLLTMFVFRDKTYPDLTINIDNRRLYDNAAFFYFFLNIFVGLVSGLFRIVKGATLGVVFLCRLDRTSFATGYKKWDRGFTAYLGFLNVLAALRHPVMLCFCQILTDERPSNERARVSTRALNRWFLAVMLIRNPSLARYRKRKKEREFELCLSL